MYFVLMVVFVDRIEYKRLIYRIGIIFSVLMMIITNESARLTGGRFFCHRRRVIIVGLLRWRKCV